MLRSLLLAACVVAVLFAPGLPGRASTYSAGFTNTSTQTWIGWHVDCTNATPDFDYAKVNNSLTPYQRWIIFKFEQGSNFYQRKGFLAYPRDRALQSIAPGATLSVVFDYTITDPTKPVSFTMYPIGWPPDGTLTTVTPENMASIGWSTATNRGATAGLVKYGCAIYEANRGLITEQENIDLGKGSYYATVDYAGGPGCVGEEYQSSTAWLGLDQFNGQPLAGVTLNRITKMKYFGFVSKEPTRTTGPYWDSWQHWWGGPSQPICLELTAENPNDPTDRRQLWFRPWGTEKASGESSGRQARRWLWYDCINGTPQVQVVRRWYVPRGLNGQGTASLDEEYASWADLVNVYGSWKLVTTSTGYWPSQGQYKSAGWDGTTIPPGSITCTATGKCLNFVVGARKGWTNVYGVENGTDAINWANRYWGFRGHVDMFTLGVDGQDVTYNFEPSPTEPDVKIVSINDKEAYDAVLGQTVIGYNNAPIRQYPHLLDYYLVKITGKVVDPTQVSFSLEDGSDLAMKTRIFLIRDDNVYYDTAHGYRWPKLGEVWSVWGFLEKTRFHGEDARPYCLWTSYYNCQKQN